MEGFARLGFLHCIVVVDGTHIFFKPHVAEYVSRKSTFSMLLQGATGHTGCLIDVEFGYSRRNHDVFLFKQSAALCGAMDAGFCALGNPTISICGAAYSIREWLRKPYGGHVDARKVHFDKCLHRARNVVECAFEYLKQQSHCLCQIDHFRKKRE